MQTKIIERIRNQIDIVEIISEYFNLTKKGKNYISVCPFHQDKNPSLTISPTKQIFKCFACGQGGDVISFVSDYEKITLQQAIKKLALKLGIEIVIEQQETIYNQKEVKILNALQDANDFFMNFLMTENGKQALLYAQSRNINLDLIEKFKIGFSSNDTLISYLKSKNHDESDLINASLMTRNNESFFKNRLTFAIENIDGVIVGFSGRVLDKIQEPKYLNSSDNSLFNKSSLLYNFFNAKKTINSLGEVIIVEGFMDVIAFAKANINHVIALMGTNLSSKHASLLSGYKVILMLDNDKAGLKATLNTIQILIKNKITPQIVDNETNLDPDEIFNQGQEQLLLKIVNKRLHWIEFIYKKLLPKKDLDSVKPIEDFIKEFKTYLLLTNELEWEFYINKICNHFNLSKEAIISLLPPRIKEQQNNYNVIKVMNKNHDFSIKPKNYSYILIRSMLKNSHFISIYKASNLKFDDYQLMSIGKYLLNYKKNSNIPEKIQEKCWEILNEDLEIIKSDVEFIEYIDRIKWNNKQSTNQKIIESIKRIKNQDIALQLLEEQIKLKRGK